MGNSQNQSQQNQIDSLSDYVFVQNLNNHSLGEVKLFNHKFSDQKVISKLQVLTQLEDKNQVIKKHEIRSQLKHNGLFNVIGLVQQEEKQFCSVFYRVQQIFQHYDINLDKMIKNQRGQHFSNDQVKSMIEQTVNVMAYLQENDIFHGNISTQNIFVDNDIKLSEEPQFNQHKQYMELLCNSDCDKSNKFISPLLMKNLRMTNIQPKHNPFKSDVFALGMVIVSVISLDSCEDCYDFKNFRINRGIIEKKINQQSSYYDFELLDIVREMLIDEEKQRPDFIDLNKRFSKQEAKIQVLCEKNDNQQQKLIVKKQRFDFKMNFKVHENQNDENIQPTKEVVEEQKKFSKKSKKIPEEQELIQKYGLDIENYFQAKNKIKINSQLNKHEDSNFFKESNDFDISIQKSFNNDQSFNKDQFFIKDQSFNKDQTFSQDHSFSKDQSFNKDLLMKLNDHRLSDKSQSLTSSQDCEKPKIRKYDISQESTQLSIQDNQAQFVTEVHANGSKYEGYKLNNKRNGTGKFYYSDGGLYDGEWFNNQMHGKGVLYYNGGKPAYDGNWVEDKFQGSGILYNEDYSKLNLEFDYTDFDGLEDYWIKYQGTFSDDCKHGMGIMNLSNGEKYIGNFKQDLFHGSGKFFTLKGKIIEGQWENNKLVNQKQH